ncbi:MAG: hypothetical protein JXB48_18125 [Candidatus Latescibacteria bacterium]|nr:hypothetical protein [Candidatus Latescibacterota bacterium]
MKSGYKIFLITVGLISIISLPLTVFGESWEKVTEIQRRKWNEQYDKKGLYKQTGMAIDKSSKFIQVPKGMNPDWLVGVEIAQTPPEIEFAPVRGIDPMYFPEDNKSLWSNWAGVTRAPNGRFYFAEGDHRAAGSSLYMWEYDPGASNYSRVLDFAHLCGWDKRGVGDSKIHGDMGVMPDGTLWILTYWDPDPKPTEEQYALWPGSHLIRYDTYTGRAQDMGIPMPKAGWPYYRLDPERGYFFAVGFRGEILNYNVRENRVTYAGYPPEGIKWGLRCTMLDPETGLFWTANQEKPHNFISFDPQTATFTAYEETTPNDLGRNVGNNSLMRAHSHKRSKGGFFWVNSQNGTLYKFWPETRRTEVVTHLWIDQTYVPRIAMSEDENYIYYVPNLVQTYSYYQPVMQFNTETYTRKVIAFIADYYFDKYGFYNGGAHGLAISQDGGTLVINFNGAFKPRIPPFYGNPALMVVRIPESERE